MDVGHDYGKGFELEQDDTLRRAEEIAEKLGRVADGMEAMVEAMTELNEEEEEDSLWTLVNLFFDLTFFALGTISLSTYFFFLSFSSFSYRLIRGPRWGVVGFGADSVIVVFSSLAVVLWRHIRDSCSE